MAAIKFQYNKTSLNDLEKRLKVRLRALPTLKNKESALRMEIKKAKKELYKIEAQIEEQMKRAELLSPLWQEFDKTLLKVRDIQLEDRKIAGVKIPELVNVEFEKKPFSLFNCPKWYLKGIALLETALEMKIKREIISRKVELLEYARKKTTQKVNLFEKVQIPGLKKSIHMIKRFLEDKENLSKASQKIIKNKRKV